MRVHRLKKTFVYSATSVALTLIPYIVMAKGGGGPEVPDTDGTPEIPGVFSPLIIALVTAIVFATRAYFKDRSAKAAAAKSEAQQPIAMNNDTHAS